MVDEAQRDPEVLVLLAETADGNQASQSVLAFNGLIQTGRRQDPDDAFLILWAHVLTSTAGRS